MGQVYFTLGTNVGSQLCSPLDRSQSKIDTRELAVGAEEPSFAVVLRSDRKPFETVFHPNEMIIATAVDEYREVKTQLHGRRQARMRTRA
jgi:hypothetical protein